MFCSAYAAAKFGVEGEMESLAPEIAPFGIRTMLRVSNARVEYRSVYVEQTSIKLSMNAYPARGELRPSCKIVCRSKSQLPAHVVLVESLFIRQCGVRQRSIDQHGKCQRRTLGVSTG